MMNSAVVLFGGGAPFNESKGICLQILIEK